MHQLDWGGRSAALKKSGVTKKPPKLSGRLQNYFGIFMSLHNHRQYHASGPQPLTFTDMQVCISMSAIPLKVIPKLFRLFSALDSTYLNYYHEHRK